MGLFRRGVLAFCGPILAGVFILPCRVPAQNLAVNPGFENGNTSGWSSFGPPVISVQTTQVHSGTYGALVQGRTATWNGIAQSMAAIMQSGQTYNISAFIRLASGTNQTVQLTMAKNDANGSQYAGVASGSVSAAAWSQLAGQYSYNLSGTLTGLICCNLIDELSIGANGFGFPFALGFLFDVVRNFVALGGFRDSADASVAG